MQPTTLNNSSSNDSPPLNITYNLDDFTTELQQNRLPTTSALDSNMFTLQFTETSKPSSLTFDNKGYATWNNLPISNTTTNDSVFFSSNSTIACNVVEVDKNLFFINLPIDKEKEQSLILIIDNLLANAIFIHSTFDDSRKVNGYASNIVQHFSYARLNSTPTIFTPTETRELLGKRVLNIYSDKTAVEHIYINSLWYTYHIHGGIRHGDCDCDEATYIKVREGVYLVAFREKAIDVSIVLAINTNTWHNTGMAIGNNADGWFALPIGARMQLLSETSYPQGYEPR